MRPWSEVVAALNERDELADQVRTLEWQLSEANKEVERLQKAWANSEAACLIQVQMARAETESRVNQIVDLLDQNKQLREIIETSRNIETARELIRHKSV